MKRVRVVVSWVLITFITLLGNGWVCIWVLCFSLYLFIFSFKGLRISVFGVGNSTILFLTILIFRGSIWIIFFRCLRIRNCCLRNLLRNVWNILWYFLMGCICFCWSLLRSCIFLNFWRIFFWCWSFIVGTRWHFVVVRSGCCSSVRRSRIWGCLRIVIICVIVRTPLFLNWSCWCSICSGIRLRFLHRVVVVRIGITVIVSLVSSVILYLFLVKEV